MAINPLKTSSPKLHVNPQFVSHGEHCLCASERPPC